MTDEGFAVIVDKFGLTLATVKVAVAAVPVVALADEMVPLLSV